MVYSVFPNPQKVFDSLRYDIQSTGLVDSLEIIGQPIVSSAINCRVDSSRLKQYGITTQEVNRKMRSYSSNEITIDFLDSLKNETLTTVNGQEIQFGAIALLYIEKSYYKPHIYKPTPKQFI